ncbi:hypothetical protein GUITHDRAFT_138959 [Guillardia theta CCMP2712]|uniref:Uncharacterized protein n=1 Tax=Guillardia theta (strain CCMP2712) TaxID=905079 RepID=L1JAQ3_GUITC|nr:hypothetical protein GUITHDRAFT_138959 [Guillardia theta CCMP2712]EKX45382.1 hypothetical protein GUITHDRAFT_138959 [Guillardia theta CCMP2712]|eukprot:XP_005832362.1 hypothetical protein GUITHDRAFT_138959 [Guillardia theta CCMP2712]
MRGWLDKWREQVKGGSGETHKSIGHEEKSSVKDDHQTPSSESGVLGGGGGGREGEDGSGSGGQHEVADEDKKKRKDSIAVEDMAWGNGMLCPYCSIPSFIARCCKLRSSEPLRWSHAQVLEALDVLSTHRHALARQLGSLPGKEDKAGGKLRFCFETQQVDGEKMFATAMGKEADAKTFNRFVLDQRMKTWGVQVSDHRALITSFAVLLCRPEYRRIFSVEGSELESSHPRMQCLVHFVRSPSSFGIKVDFQPSEVANIQFMAIEELCRLLEREAARQKLLRTDSSLLDLLLLIVSCQSSDRPPTDQKSNDQLHQHLHEERFLVATLAGLERIALDGSNGVVLVSKGFHTFVISSLGSSGENGSGDRGYVTGFPAMAMDFLLKANIFRGRSISLSLLQTMQSSLLTILNGIAQTERARRNLLEAGGEEAVRGCSRRCDESGPSERRAGRASSSFELGVLKQLEETLKTVLLASSEDYLMSMRLLASVVVLKLSRSCGVDCIENKGGGGVDGGGGGGGAEEGEEEEISLLSLKALMKAADESSDLQRSLQGGSGGQPVRHRKEGLSSMMLNLLQAVRNFCLSSGLGAVLVQDGLLVHLGKFVESEEKLIQQECAAVLYNLQISLTPVHNQFHSLPFQQFGFKSSARQA